MDIPPPPDDLETKNIIDKLANFVARNGMEFEKMTKDKQQQNPKFSFLFGGDHFNYYQYKLNTERQIFGQQQVQDNMIQHSLQNAPWQQPGNPQQSGKGPPMPPSLMSQFARPPQMGGRMPMPNMPPWQNPPMSRPPMNMQRFRPPGPGPNMHPSMGQPPGQMFQGPPPSNNQNSGPNMPPSHQQLGPRNFMFQQPPPNMPPQGQFPPGQQNQFQPFESGLMPPTQFNQPGNVLPENNFNSSNGDLAKSLAEEEDEELAKEEENARTKIDESSSNLKQQYEVLMSQQQEKIEVAIQNAQDAKLRELASDTGIMTSDFDAVLQPIINTCTKDSISAGKLWILTHAKTKEHCEVIGFHLLKRVLEAEKSSLEESESGRTKFEHQLHIVYLINDVLHHSSRKNLEDLSTALQSVILPIFCMASANATKDEKERLSKLLGLWQKFKYFKEDLLAKLKDPENSLSEYQAGLIIEHAKEVQKVQREIQEQYDSYEQQHNEYANHVSKLVEDKRREIEKKRQDRAKLEEQEAAKGNQELPPWADNYNEDENRAGYDYGNDTYNDKPQVIDYSHSRDPSEWQEPEWIEDDFGPPAPWNQGPRGPRMGGPWRDGPWGGPRGPRGPRPRGPRPRMEPDPALIPTVPYYDLPAGLMCPLVKLEDCDYLALNPKLIRLPAPIPPSARLLAAVEAFYGPPSHERPRDVDGWERNGLFEFYRAKTNMDKTGDKGTPRRNRNLDDR